jgi:hemerythrin-like domain-containing protein
MSLLEAMKVHEYLDELFLQHQEALLQLDIELAAERLMSYEHELRLHMQVEEEWLLPVYARAGKIPGGPPEFFTGEHRRMREFLERIAARLEEMKLDRANLSRRVIALFDEEAAYKNLLLHHEMRERNLLFPTLDRVTDETERRELVNRCLAAHALAP